MMQGDNANNDLFGKSDQNEWEIVETPSLPTEQNAPENTLFSQLPEQPEVSGGETGMTTPEASAAGETPEIRDDIPMEVQTEAQPEIWDDIPAENPTEVQPEITSGLPVENQPEQNTAPDLEAPVAGENTPENFIAEAPVADKVAVTPEKAATPAPASASEEIPVRNYRHTAPDGIATLDELGRYLVQIRVTENLTPEKVCDATKIRPDYLEAIETGNVSELPQAVYVLAYIRKLCELYDVDTSGLKNFFNDLRDGFTYELPENINKSIVGHENDEDQQRKLRQLALALISSAAVVAAAILVGIVILLVSVARSGVFSSGNGIKDSEIIELQGKAQLPLYLIPARRN